MTKTLKDAASDVICAWDSNGDNLLALNEAIEDLIVALNADKEQPAEQEPYAWMAVGGTIWRHKTTEDDVPLYTAPQPRREVELTDEEIDRALDAANVPELPAGYKSVELEIARAVIKAYKAKQEKRNDRP